MITRASAGDGQFYPSPTLTPAWAIFRKFLGSDQHVTGCGNEEMPVAECSCHDETWGTAESAILADAMCLALNYGISSLGTVIPDSYRSHKNLKKFFGKET